MQEPMALRKVYFDAWQKALKSQHLTEMEALIVDIIKRHPEYHPIFSTHHFDELKSEKFALDHNPFFHLALHVTIAEQIKANRPEGIQAYYFALLKKHGDQTLVEHKMMECLARILMEGFNDDTANSEQLYLEAIQLLI